MSKTRIVIVIGLLLLAIGHAGMMMLYSFREHLAPRIGQVVDGYSVPLFYQNWRLFAPDVPAYDAQLEYRDEPLIEYLEKMKFMLDVDVKDQSNNYAVLRAAGMADNIGGPYALVPRGELSDTVSAFNKTHTQVGIWALEAL
ncbi:MAG: DUF5819 family protein, partial [Flavobacteriales bacterium]